MKTITLTCRGCGRDPVEVAREPYDPPIAVRADILCEECSEGSMEPPTFYYDAAGEEITGGPFEVTR